ncbi:MAG: hypothetical protein HY077_12925 [Elusimicrobia bacterium]|nr:hypothetical protein [Elusimicrobiota bacterium]
MKRLLMLVAAGLILGLTPGAFGQAVDPGVRVYTGDKLSLNVAGRGQMLGVYEYVPDPYRDHNRVYLFLKQARLGVKGRYEDVSFDTQFAFGGEDSNGSNTDLSLLDFVADVPIYALGKDTILKIGQFRVPYSREGLTDRGYMDFADRSVANLGSYQSRDYGLALMATQGVWTGTFGTFSSGGRDVPQRYIPERFGVPYMVARLGYNDGVDQDIYHVVQADLNLKRTTKAFMVNGIYMKDTLIGHSSTLQAKTIDKNLLIDSGFNPYINQGGPTAANPATQPLGTIAGSGTMQRGDMWFVGGDAVVRHPLGERKAVEAEAEGNWGGYQNRFGVIHVANARAQVDYRFSAFEVGLRYAELWMDKKSGFLSSSATGAAATAGAKVLQQIKNDLGIPVTELDPALTWHIKGHNLKVVADLPIYLNCPIWYDAMGNVTPLGSQPLGAYAFPDPTSTTQNSVLATPGGNNTKRQTVVEARLMFQFMF